MFIYTPLSVSTSTTQLLYFPPFCFEAWVSLYLSPLCFRSEKFAANGECTQVSRVMGEPWAHHHWCQQHNTMVFLHRYHCPHEFYDCPRLYSFHAASMTKACCDGPALRTLQGGDKVRSKWRCEFRRRLFLLPTEFQQQVKIIRTNSQKGSNKMPVSLPGNLDIQSFFCN